MGWLRDRLARLGVRSPAGRDAVAAAALAVLGLARAVVALVVSGGRLPVPAWQLAACRRWPRPPTSARSRCAAGPPGRPWPWPRRSWSPPPPKDERA